jgi:hypothetical protein
MTLRELLSTLGIPKGQPVRSYDGDIPGERFFVVKDGRGEDVLFRVYRNKAMKVS